MNVLASQFERIVPAVVLLIGALSISSRGQTNGTSIVTLTSSDDIQSAVNANQPGTTFVLTAGIYRMQSVEPKNGDIFTGQGRVILNGSQTLNFQDDGAGDGLWVAKATANSLNHGNCKSLYPLCGYTQDLFIDGVLQLPISSPLGLKSGTWYFDRANSDVYISSNPTGHTVEIGVQAYAFYGSASEVQIQNLIVEKYAAPAQTGAVGGNSSGVGWLVNKVESRWNHGRGISLGSGSQISNSFIHHNGQLGISLYGANSMAINNEISWNNYAGFDTSWEAGGSKFTNTVNLTVQSNYVHDNLGPGLWTDTNNVFTLYDDNTVANNQGAGIVHEISYNAIIRNNSVKGNGDISTVWLWNSQIQVQNSSNVQVFGNTVEVPDGGGNGIALINQNRGTGTLGVWVATNDYVHDNTVTYSGISGSSGFVDDTGGDVAVSNLLDFNHYILKGGGAKHWSWVQSMSWTDLQGIGQEVHGSCCE